MMRRINRVRVRHSLWRMAVVALLLMGGCPALLAQVPTLSSISPNNATAGSPGFTLTVSGTNFNVSSQVQWNGTPRATTFISGTQLTAAIRAADVSSAGVAQVTVFNPGIGASNALAFDIHLALFSP